MLKMEEYIQIAQFHLNTVTFSCWAKLTQTNPVGARGYICLSKDGYGLDSVRSGGQWFFWNNGNLTINIDFIDVFESDMIYLDEKFKIINRKKVGKRYINRYEIIQI